VGLQRTLPAYHAPAPANLGVRYIVITSKMHRRRDRS
jgi:hypothetical protein